MMNRWYKDQSLHHHPHQQKHDHHGLSHCWKTELQLTHVKQRGTKLFDGITILDRVFCISLIFLTPILYYQAGRLVVDERFIFYGLGGLFLKYRVLPFLGLIFGVLYLWAVFVSGKIGKKYKYNIRLMIIWIVFIFVLYFLFLSIRYLGFDPQQMYGEW